MSIAHPLWLALGLAVAIVFAALMLRALRVQRAATVTYSDLAFLVAATGSRGDPGRLIGFCAIAAVVLGALAAGGPRIVVPVPVHGSVIICVDTSGSMRSTDVEPTRAAAAAAAVRAFVNAVPAGTEVGLVAFAGSADLIAPLTSEPSEMIDAIARLPAPNGGTAIGDALAAAAAQLPASGRRSIVLVTDGVNNAGSDPQHAAEQLGQGGVEIDTIGIGTNDSGRLIPGTDEAAAIDDDALRTIANDAHGVFAHVGDAGALRERLAALAASTTHEPKRVDLAVPFALTAVVVLAVAVAGGMLAGRFP